ncbi:TPA: hypothetical protein KNH83_003841 [Clostridioides difficile]|nr:hypothetical protein [Clostridioides difficile]HBE9381606.1 hypothetical protein [Clostridioides difficile]
MRLNNREKNLLKILLILVIMVASDIVVNYLEANLTSLKNEKQNIINKINNQDNYQIKGNKHIDDKYIESVELNENEELKNNFNNSFLDKKTNKDIVLLVENELKNIVNIEYINQESSLDNHNKKQVNLEIKVNGELENVLKFEDVMKKLRLNNKLEKIEINKLKVNNFDAQNILSEYKQEKDNIVECKMTVRVT